MEKKRFVGVMLALMLGCGLTTWAAALPVPVSSEVGTGFWMANFAAATNLARKAAAPMVLFWTNKDCGYCAQLEEAVNSAEFKTWMNAHPNYIYCYVQGVNSKDVEPNAGSRVYEFARYAAGTRTKSLSGYPFLTLYWPQSSGKIKATGFVGRTGQMLVGSTGRTLAKELADSIGTYFAGYAPKTTVAFGCGDDAGAVDLENRNDRLEAEPSTSTVYVPLVRSGSLASQTKNTLVVTWPDDIMPVTSNAFTWTALATNGAVAVDVRIPPEASYPENRRIDLTLLDASGKVVGTNGITFVAAKANSCTNPYWLGERDEDTLGFAEWTHDYELVRQKVAAGKADYTLAVFSGTMWCPYCQGFDDTFVQTEAFKAWCTSNRVQVALFDQAQTAANGGGSQLLTYLPGVEHILYTNTVTGASYLSRHGLRDTDAEVVKVRNRTLAYSTSKWLAPETTAVRLGNPTILLIDAKDNVVGRFNAWRDRNKVLAMPYGNKHYDPAENIARLDDLLTLADRGSEAQDYASTTTNDFELGGSVTSRFQVNDASDHYLIKLDRRGEIVFSVADKTADRLVRLALLRDGVETISSTNGELSVEITRADLAAKRLVLRVTAPELVDSSANTRFGGTTVFAATILNSFVPILKDESTVYAAFSASSQLSSYVVAKNQKVTVSLVSGKLPKGLSLAWNAATSSVVVKGTATSIGTYSFTYKVTIKTASGKVVSTEKTAATITVASAASVNPFYGRSFVASVPLYKTDIWGVKTLSSAIQISQSSKKALSAKRFVGTTTSFSGTWKKFDPETGLLTSTLKKGSVSITVKLTAEGVLTTTISGNSGSVSVAHGYTRFAGSYTVTLPVTETTAWYYTFGSGYLTLKTSTLSASKGLVSYAGALPNGVAVSGSAYLGGDPEDPEYALLPIYKRSTRNLTNGSKKYATKDDLAAVLRIQADGASLYMDEEKVRVVLAPAGVSSIWRRTTSALDHALVATMNVYGGYYVPGGTLNDWLALFNLGTEANLIATVDGEIVPAVWKFSSATGVLTGTAKTTIDRRTVTATFKGVILPGWNDCGCGDELIVRPFASGTFYYANRLNGISTPASLEFNLDRP